MGKQLSQGLYIARAGNVTLGKAFGCKDEWGLACAFKATLEEIILEVEEFIKDKNAFQAVAEGYQHRLPYSISLWQRELYRWIEKAKSSKTLQRVEELLIAPEICLVMPRWKTVTGFADLDHDGAAVPRVRREGFIRSGSPVRDFIEFGPLLVSGLSLDTWVELDSKGVLDEVVRAMCGYAKGSIIWVEAFLNEYHALLDDEGAYPGKQDIAKRVWELSRMYWEGFYETEPICPRNNDAWVSWCYKHAMNQEIYQNEVVLWFAAEREKIWEFYTNIAENPQNHSVELVFRSQWATARDSM